MFVCMYVCTYVRTYAFIYVCVCVCVCVCSFYVFVWNIKHQHHVCSENIAVRNKDIDFF